MSSEADQEADERCASCGKSECDDVKLKNCTACKLVKYCGVICQKKHRPQHKKACKKRAAELKDELLFKQPECTDLGDCPICLLPIPIATSQDIVRSSMYDCCSKVVCNGCAHANRLREKERRLTPSCPFCRHPLPRTDEESDLNQKKRIEANDPVALDDAAIELFNAGEYVTAIEYWEKAAGLGHIESHYHLSIVHDKGQSVAKDKKKATYHEEKAAIGGHVFARHNLGAREEQKGNMERAAKHWIISANHGCDRSIEKLKECYAKGVVSKEDLAAALRAHQAAVIATRSPQRDAAEEAQDRGV